MLLLLFFSLLLAPLISAIGPWSSAPYLVKIYGDGEFLCTGTLITGYTVLTAASCFNNHKIDILEVRNFKWSRSSVKSLTIYPEYHQDDPCFQDIAVLLLSDKPKTFETKHTLPILCNYVDDDSELVTAELSPYSRSVYRPILEVSTNRFCSGSNWYLCAKNTHGDSYTKLTGGGPVINSDTNRVVAVNSKSDCKFRNVVAFAKLSDVNWIKQQIRRGLLWAAKKERSKPKIISDKPKNKHWEDEDESVEIKGDFTVGDVVDYKIQKIGQGIKLVDEVAGDAIDKAFKFLG